MRQIKQLLNAFHTMRTQISLALLREIWNEAEFLISVSVLQQLLKYSVKWGSPRLAHKIAPALFKDRYTRDSDGVLKKGSYNVYNQQHSKDITVEYFSKLMAQYTHLDQAHVIVVALQYAPDDFKSALFEKSVDVRSHYYTEKLIPEEVNNHCLVALISNNNMPVLAQVITDKNKNFVAATAAMLKREKLLEMFGGSVDYSHVLTLLHSENWNQYTNHRDRFNKEQAEDLLFQQQQIKLAKALESQSSSARMTRSRKM